MPTVVQFRRGTTAQNNNFTGAAGEISYDNQLNSIRVHNGSTAGGFESITTSGAQTLTNKTLDSATISGALFASDSDAIDIGTDNVRFRGAYIGTLYTKNGIVKAQPVGVSVTYRIVHTGDSDLGSLAVTNNSGTIEVKFTRNPANTILVKAHQTIIT